MSRPSMMTLFFFASSRWVTNRKSRTAGTAETQEAYLEIRGVRIASPTSAPSSSIFCSPFS